MVRNSREEWKTWQGVFDQFTEKLLFRLSGQGHFDHLRSIISPGKEAVVFVADRGEEQVAVKIYKLETAKFSKMFGYLRVDPRLSKLGKGGIGDPKRRTIFSWVEREYRNMLLARNAGVRVPMPIAYKDNVLVMEFIGHEAVPAPLLKYAAPDDPELFAAEVFDMVEAYAKAGFVHGDLSEYNIINQDEQPVLIDFSHSAPLKAPNSKELLERDIHNLCVYFERQGVRLDRKELMERMIKAGQAAA